METIQAESRDRTLYDNITWKIVVFILRLYGGDFWGVGIVDVLCNTITVFLDRRFTSEIGFHDMLRGFRERRGTVTASLEASLLQKLTSTR